VDGSDFGFGFGIATEEIEHFGNIDFELNRSIIDSRVELTGGNTFRIGITMDWVPDRVFDTAG